MADGELTPRNLSARLRAPVAGNPATSRLEDAVANCFPGLELDVRALDRRFFPGLLFSFHPVANPAVPGSDTVQGAQLDYVDYEQDPMLDPRDPTEWVQQLLAALQGGPADAVGDGDWYLHAVQQGDRRIEMYEYTYYENGTIRIPLEGEAVWWIVRGLVPDVPLTIWLTQRDDAGQPAGAAVEFTGMRRRFVTGDGVYDAAYRAGEFTASLCSPWTHDFRDCACHYWAANHPDVVLGEELPRAGVDDPSTTLRLDWERVDHSPSGAIEAETTIPDARQHRFDQYQINQQWEQLPFVVGNREVGPDYSPPPPPVAAKPYRRLKKLVKALETKLAPVELTLVAEYLFAYYSVKAPDEVDAARWPSLPDDVANVRQLIRMIAVSEMTHVRWVNQILWLLDNAGLFPSRKSYQPVVKLSRTIPISAREPARHRRLERLTPETLADFIAVEQPADAIFTTYARAIETMREVAPDAMNLALRIDRDGARHFELFHQMRKTLTRYHDASDEHPYLRSIAIPERGDVPEDVWALAERALARFHEIVETERLGYELEAAGRPSEAQRHYQRGRELMSGGPESFDSLADELARKGYGVPFW